MSMSRRQSAAVERLLSMDPSALGRSMSLARGASSFDEDVFVSNSFKADSFIAGCRNQVSIPVLKSELQSHLRTLKKELVELINKDYADFVNLSANLVGLDRAIAAIREPLHSLRTDIAEVRTDVETAMLTLDAKLEERALIREKKALLQLFLNISDSIHKIEKLLGTDDTPSKQNGDGREPLREVGRMESLVDTTADSAQLVERVAAEYNQLNFYVSQCADLPFVKQAAKRIHAITEILSDSLESMLRAGLAANDEGATEQALRIYAVIDQVGRAEELYRSLVVDPFMAQNITTEKLHSLGLSGLYSKVREFIEGTCSLVIAISAKPGLARFDFLVNAVWPSLAAAVQKNLPNVFAPGVPDVFYENYMNTVDFVSYFELQCRSQARVRRLRETAAFTDFMKLWSLPIYFQLRFQEIASDFEEALSEQPLAVESTTTGEDGFLLPVCSRLWADIQRTWQPGVFMPMLAHRFWKLHLQLLSRFLTWIKELPRPTGTAPDDSTEGAVGARENVEAVVFFLYLACDCEHMRTKLAAFDSTVLSRLNEMTNVTEAFVKVGMDEVFETLSAVQPQLSTAITDSLTAQCITNLKPVWQVTAAYRMTNKEMPTEPSDFVAAILQPLASILIDKAQYIGAEQRKAWALAVLGPVTRRYAEITSEVLTTVNKTEASLLRLRKIRKKKEGAPVLGTDEDKIRRQLFLDAEAFGAQIEEFGLGRADVAEFKQLWDGVQEGNPAQQGQE